MKSQIRHQLLWLPLTFLVATLTFALSSPKGFIQNLNAINQWILAHFSSMFSIGVSFFLVLVVIAYVSNFGKLRIGGEKALPILTKPRWMAISLCTTVATGILFWACAEPMYHLSAPPSYSGAEPFSKAAQVFALSTLYLHWSFLPYGIYTLAAIVFAVSYYNLKQPFSLSTMVYPIVGARIARKMSTFIDLVCLFTLIAGMSASLGTGLLTLSGGVDKILKQDSSSFMQIVVIGCIIVATFVVSSVTGLQKGIKILSQINVWFFAVLLGVFLLFGPVLFIFDLSLSALREFIIELPARATGIGLSKDQAWIQSWSVFYWCNWLAWTPITAMFLGRISIGYTIREVIRINFLYPSLFAIVWMSIFGGTTIYYEQLNHDLFQTMQQRGPESVVYKVFDQLPLSGILSIVFLLTVFLSYVTSADSNTSAMGGICVRGDNGAEHEAPMWIKFAWGSSIGALAIVMVGSSGIEGIKILSNLGGVPSLFLMAFVALGAIRLIGRGC